MSGATSYRKVHAFTQAHYKTLDETFDLNWKKLPAYTILRDIIQGMSPAEIEVRFRAYSAHLINDSICAALMPAQSLQEPEIDQQIVGVTNWAGVSGWQGELEQADMSVDLSIVCACHSYLLTKPRAVVQAMCKILHI